MRNNTFALNVPTSVAAGTAQVVRDLREKYVQIAGTFSATLSLEASLDGANFIAVATGLTTAQFVAIPVPATHLRVRTTAYTSGTPVVIVGGFDDNG